MVFESSDVENAADVMIFFLEKKLIKIHVNKPRKNVF